jgi:ADP-heptose:LPS heptosyltransferase
MSDEPPNPWRAARRILCIRLDSLGDVLLCTPAIRALRASLPGSHLTLLTSPAAAAVAPHIPELDAVIGYAAPWMQHDVAGGAAALLECAARLAAERFDGAVIFTSPSKSPLPAALLCHLAEIPLRLASCREDPCQLLSHWVPEDEPEGVTRHEVQRQLDLVGHIGCATEDTRLSFAVPPAARARVTELLGAAGVDPQSPYLVLHAGANVAARRYPLRHWLVLIGLLGTHVGHPIILTGDQPEAESLRPLAETWVGPAHSLIGKLDVGELGALIQSASLLITGNNGPAQIAAALGTPLLDLHALANPQTHWRVSHRLLFHDDERHDSLRSSRTEGTHDCLDQLSPRTVIEAAIELLASAPPRPARTDNAPLALA